MNSKQSFLKSTFTFIILAAFLGVTPTCHAAIDKPRIKPQALAEWQQKVARIVWTAKNLNPYQIDGLIKKNKPEQEELITNLAAATSKKEKQPGFIAQVKGRIQQASQSSHVTQALEAFIKAQNEKTDSSKLAGYVNTFKKQFEQLDEENLVKLAQELNNLIDEELQVLEKKLTQYQPTIKYCSKFLVITRDLTAEKFKIQRNERDTKIRSLENSKSPLKDALAKYNQQAQQMDFDKKIIATQELMKGKLKLLLQDWKDGSPERLIDIAVDPEPDKRLFATETEEKYRIKFSEIEHNQELAPLLQKLHDQYNQKAIIEQNKKTLMHDLDQINLEEEYERQEMREKHPAFEALSKLIDQWTHLDKRQIAIQREQQLQSMQTKKPATSKHGATMAIPSSQEQKREESEAKKKEPLH